MVSLTASSTPPHHWHHIHNSAGHIVQSKAIMVAISDGHRDPPNDIKTGPIHMLPGNFYKWDLEVTGPLISYGSKAQRCRLGTTDNHLSWHVEKGLSMKLTQKS